jgi:very-short-patch-repair endonuclease
LAPALSGHELNDAKGLKRLADENPRFKELLAEHDLEMDALKARLVIETDGDIHANPNRAAHDTERTAWLAAQHRCRVIRFDNVEVLHNIDSIIEIIRAVL